MFLRLFKKINNQKVIEQSGRLHKGDSSLLIHTGILMLVGLVVIYAIGPARANLLNHVSGSDYSDDHFFIKQLTSVIIATITFVVLSKINYQFWIRNSLKIVLFSLFLSILLAISGFFNLPLTQCTLGACRWFDLGPLGTFQPSELLKFGLLMFLANFIATKIRNDKFHDNNETLYPVAAITLFASFLIIVLQKDMGTGITLFSIVLCMVIVAGINNKLLGKIIITTISLLIVFIISSPHRIDRVTTFFKIDNSTTSEASSYHIEHAKIALGSGGLFGVGVGNSVQATGYLPEAINDSVFAIIGEMFGFVGALAILFLLFGMLNRIFKIMHNSIEITTKLIMAGIFGWISSHVILNITSMIGIFPLTGITLPLLSYGGTSFIFISAIIAISYQISKSTSTNLRKDSYYENSSRRGWIRRSRNSGNFSNRSY